MQGGELRRRMEAMAQRHDFIGDTRGMGLMQAFEMVTPGSKDPDGARATAVVNAARERGLLIGKGGRYGNVLRIAPMLDVTGELIAEGCGLLEQALEDAANG